MYHQQRWVAKKARLREKSFVSLLVIISDPVIFIFSLGVGAPGLGLEPLDLTA